MVTQRIAVITFALGLALAACEGDVNSPVGLAPEVSATDLLVKTSGGHTIPIQAEAAVMRRLTRQLARAMADDGVRQTVYGAIQQSPQREGKLHLRTFLRGNNNEALTRIAAAASGSADDLVAALDSLVDLEFYMPVPAHRDTWKGGKQLLVASLLDDDGSEPVAFDLTGREVTVSNAAPPAVPTLVVVPVETDFSRPSSTDATRMFNSYGSTPGLYMTYAEIPDNYEPWPMGDPEYEFHVSTKLPGGPFTYISCAGGQMPGLYYYNQDGTTWNGAALLAAETDIGEREVEIQVWEDDTEGCQGNGTGWEPTTDIDVANKLTQWGAASVAVISQVLPDSISPTKLIGAIILWGGASYNLYMSLHKDDYVGVVEGPARQCWPEASGPVYFDINVDPGVEVGRAKLDNTFGVRSPLCPLTVSLSGPSEVYGCPAGPTPAANYTTAVYGGVGTKQYEWREDFVVRGTGPSYEMYNTTPGQRRVDVTVTRGTETVTKTMWTDVSDPGSEEDEVCEW